jgi:hypothetical protein
VGVKGIGSEDVNWFNLAKDSYLKYSGLYKMDGLWALHSIIYLGREGFDWIILAHDGHQQQIIVDTVVNCQE